MEGEFGRRRKKKDREKETERVPAEMCFYTFLWFALLDARRRFVAPRRLCLSPLTPQILGHIAVNEKKRRDWEKEKNQHGKKETKKDRTRQRKRSRKRRNSTLRTVWRSRETENKIVLYSLYLRCNSLSVTRKKEGRVFVQFYPKSERKTPSLECTYTPSEWRSDGEGGECSFS